MAIELTTASATILADIRNTIGVNVIQLLLPDARLVYNSDGTYNVPSGMAKTIDFTGFSNFRCFNFSDSSYANISALRGGQFLTDLEDLGTQKALILPPTPNLPTVTLSSFFEALPVTTKTVTVKFTGTGGAQNTQLSGTLVSILTTKGYTAEI